MGYTPPLRSYPDRRNYNPNNKPKKGVWFYVSVVVISLWITRCTATLLFKPQIPYQLHQDVFPTPTPLTPEEMAQRKQLEAEIATYTQAIRKHDFSAETYFLRGQSYYKLKRSSEAISDFSQAIEMNPDDYRYYVYRAIVYSLYDLDKAVADFTRAIELQPDMAENYYYRGKVYATQGSFDRAVADYNYVIKLLPSSVDAYYSRAVVYYRLDQLDTAINDCNQAISLNPDYSKVYPLRGYLYYHKGDYDAALADFEEYVRLAGDKADVQVMNAIAQMRSYAPLAKLNFEP